MLLGRKHAQIRVLLVREGKLLLLLVDRLKLLLDGELLTCSVDVKCVSIESTVSKKHAKGAILIRGVSSDGLRL